MKKFIAFMLAALIGVAASSAQVIESRMGGVYIEKGPAPEHRWFAKLGAGLALQKFGYNAIPDAYYSSLSTAKGAALDLSLGYNRDFKYGSSWYWGGKLGVTLNFLSQHYDAGGGRERNPNHPNCNYEVSYEAQSIGCVLGNLHFGPTIGFRKPVGNGVKLDINFTPEFVYTWNADGDHKDFKQIGEEVCDNPSRYTEPFEMNDWVYFDDFSPIAVAATLGVDLWIKNFIVGVNYRFVYDSDNCGENNSHNIMFNVGLAF